MERLGAALRAEVEALQGALRTATRRERQRAEGRAAEEGSRVKSGLEQTRSIRHYLAALLAEEDPFLLIWVRYTLIQYTYTLAAGCLHKG